MKVQTLARRLCAALIFACLSLAPPARSHAQADAWNSVRSENFLVVGHLAGPELRQVATGLEKFRAVFSQLLAADYFDRSVPTVVIVFRDEDEYKPFKPLYRGQPVQNVAGYFQPGPEVNYITLSADGRRGADLSSVAFHEYVHLLVKNRFGRVPVWINEGLAEYYRAFELTDGNRKIKLGGRLPARAQHLRAHELLPLETLAAVDYHSPHYNEHDKRGIFYAQSWALVHYLLNGAGDDDGQQRLSHFLELLAAGVSFEAATPQAFGADTSTLERRLREYVRRARYLERAKLLTAPPQFDSTTPSAALTEAEAQAYLGDLLLRADRREEAEAYLQRAATLDPNLSRAHISLGILRLRESCLAEAKEHLQRALTTDPQSYLAHYHYADLLRREIPEAVGNVAAYVESTRQIRAELKKAIELAPDFLNAYGLLALIDAERSPQLDEATALLQQAMEHAPRRQDFTLLRAHIHVRKEEFNAARQMLEKLVKDSSLDLRLRAEARTLLETLAAREEAATARRQARDGDTPTNVAPPSTVQPCDMPEPGPQIKPLRFAGEQICGQLISVECAETGVLLHIAIGDRTLKLRSDALNRIRFVTYTTEAGGKIECGLRANAHPVLVTYRPSQKAGAQVDGEAVAVEFVPADWNH